MKVYSSAVLMRARLIRALGLRVTESAISLTRPRGAAGVHRTAHARLAEHADHGLLGVGANAGGALQLLRHGCGGRRRLCLYRLCLHRRRLGGFTHLAFGLCCGCVGQIQSLGDVDQHLLDAGFAYAQQILGVFEQKTLAPERMLHPRAAKFVQVHSQAKLPHMDALEHET